MRSQVARTQVSATTTRNLRKLLLDALDQAAAGGITLGVGERIKQARVEAGLTQDQLADIIGVGMRQIQYYEADESDPYRKIGKIAEATGKSLGWLLHGGGAVTPDESFARLEAEVAEVRRSQKRQEKMLKEILAKPARRAAPSSG